MNTEIHITCNTAQAQAAVKAMKNELSRLENVYKQLVQSGKTNSKQAKNTADNIRNLKNAIKESEQEMNSVEKVITNLADATGRQLTAALNKVKKKIKEVSSNSSELKTLQEQYRKINDQIRILNSGNVNIEKTLRNIKSTPIEELRRAAEKLKIEMEGCARGTREYANKQNQLKAIRNEIDQATGAANKHAGAWQTTLKNMTAYFGLFQMFSLIQDKIRSVFTLNLKFSDQLADIRKVSNMAMYEINDLSRSLAKIDTRTTIEELNQIAYAGAKLGIGQYGVEGLEGFVRAANQVNVALKEDLGEDALTALSKITEVMGLIPKMGVEQSMLATGSAMFKLASTSTATSNNIVEFAKRLTGMARTAGITTDQLLALGSAADSMYLMPEVASTAFNKFISSLQTKHNLIEKNLQIEPGTINQLYSAGRAVDAMVLIFSKMREKGNMNALQGIFKDLGSDGARLVNVMVTMANNVDMLKKHLAESRMAFADATAVTTEYNIQQNTANAIMERATNIWEKAFVNPEGVAMVQEMAKSWYDLSKSLTTSQAFMGAINTVIKAIAWTVKNLNILLPPLLVLLGMKGVVTAVLAVKRAIDATRGSLVAYALQIEGVTAAWKSLNAAQKANIIGLVAYGLTELTLIIMDFCSKTEEATEYMKGFKESISDVQRTIGETQGEMENYYKAITDATQGTKERLAAINTFNSKYGQYLDNLLNEKSSAEELAKAYNKVNEALRNKALLEAMQDDMKNQVYTRKGWEAQKLYAYNEEAQKGNKKQYGSTWLKGYTQDAMINGKSLRDALNGVAEKLGTKMSDYIYQNRSNPDVDGKTWTPIQRQLLLAAKYMSQAYSTVNAEKRVRDKWAPYQEDIAKASPKTIAPQEQQGLPNQAPDKDAVTKAKQERIAQEKAWRDELKEKQDEAVAIINKVKNFYERQKTEILRTANEQNWDTALTNSAVNVVEKRMNEALANARKSIAGVESNWETFKNEMDKDIKEMDDKDTGYNESRTLLNEIKAVDIKVLRERMATLSKNLNTPESAATDAIWKNSSLNEQANETIEMKQRKAVNARLLEDNYTAKVNDQYTQSMETMGFFNLDKDQTDTLIAGGEDAAKMIKERAKEIEMVLKNARENIVRLYATNTNIELFDLLFGKNYNQQQSQIKAVFKLQGNDLKAFYEELIKYANDYTEAQRKAAEREKKILEQRVKTTQAFTRSLQATTEASYRSRGIYQFTAAAMSQIPTKEVTPARAASARTAPQSQIPPDALPSSTPTKPTAPAANEPPSSAISSPSHPSTYKNGGTSFFQSFNYDPEMESLRAIMALREQELALAQKTHASKQVIAEQEKAMWDAQADYYSKLGDRLQSQIEEMTALTQPVQDFGTNIGKAFATMTTDAEAGRAAIKQAIGDMINDFMKQTVSMAQEYIKRRIQQKMYDRLMSKQIKDSAEEQKNIETEKGDVVTDAAKDMGKDVMKETKKQGKNLLKTKEKAAQEETKAEEEKQTEMTDITEKQGEVREFLNEDVEQNISDATAQIGSETLVTQQAQAQTEVQTESAKTQANTVMGIASGASKIIGSLGWWGIPLIAVIQALLNGLLSFAMSKVSSLFGGGGGGNDSGPNTKLVSGMLTYDSGNVQAFRGVFDGKSYPVVGNDGKVYAATDAGELSTGLVKDPITTMVNGQPALVAEKGPEMVIGRETTAAMMMSRPDLIREIITFDKNRSGASMRTYATFDQGNIAAISAATQSGMSGSSGSSSISEIASLNDVLSSLSSVLAAIQQNGIPASINMYGNGGLQESITKANAFMSRNRRR